MVRKSTLHENITHKRYRPHVPLFLFLSNVVVVVVVVVAAAAFIRMSVMFLYNNYSLLYWHVWLVQQDSFHCLASHPYSK